jgi:uncharacterized protein
MTMLKRAAIAVLVLAPLAASAQAPPLQSRPFGTPPSAGGITVAGRGLVRIPVKTLRFAAYARGPADEKGALAAMRAAGVDDPAIGPAGPQISFNNGGPTMLRGTIHDASQAKLERIGVAALDYIRAHPGATLDNVQFAPHIDDCPTAEQTARTMAIADARRKAEAIAAATGLTLGPVIAVNENGGCQPDLETYNGPQPLDLATLTTTLQLNEVVTYSAAPAEPARRRAL